MSHSPIAIKSAKPRVRLKNQDGGYKETQEYDDFKAGGGSSKDRLDDERWLPGKSEQKTKGYVLSREFTYMNPVTHNTALENNVLWNPRSPNTRGTVGPRTPTSPYIAFKLAARACKTEKGKGADIAKDFREQFGMSLIEQLTTESRIQGLYVGVSAVNCLPVIMWKGYDGSAEVTDTDGLDSFELGVQSGGINGGKDVIWLENMLIPGNISYLKSALKNRLRGQKKQRFLKIMKRENFLLEAGYNPTGVAKTLPSNESSERKPAIRRSIHHGPTYDTLHFKMRWPPIAALEFPKEMIDEMAGFLSKHPHDNIPMTTALAAAIIYTDLAQENWVSEGFACDYKSAFDIKVPTIGQFILYFPHMLRYVENKCLTQFIHPARFATFHYSKDKNDMKINSASIDIKRIRRWCSQIRSRHPQVPKHYRFNLLPASMPGTGMVFPQDCTDAELPSMDLFRICCLSDIRTLGLPSYQYRDGDRGFRHIAGPSWLFSKYLDPPSHAMQGYLARDYWRPSPVTHIAALTGKARKLDISFPDIPSSYYTDDTIIAECVKRRFNDEPIPVNNEPIPVSNEPITVDDEPIPVGDEPERAEKRPRISEPTSTLGTAAKERIEALMSSATALSRDWDALSLHLEDEPTVQEAKQLLSQVHPFILSLEDLPHINSDDSGNEKGNLEAVLRLAYRSVGLDPQLALTRHEKNWASQFSTFSQFGQSIERAFKDLFVLKPLEDGYRFALPSIVTFANSPLVQDQIRIYKEINALLEEDAASV